MEESLKLVLEAFTMNEVGSAFGLEQVEAHFGCTLPQSYKSFMMKCDGGEGFVGEQYLILWKAGELVQFNAEYEVSKYAPSLLLFGSNGGGEAFAFDTRDKNLPIVMVPFIGMSLEETVIVSESFDGFLLRIADGEFL